MNRKFCRVSDARSCLAACVFVLLAPGASAQTASTPSILGTYSGTFSGQDSFCSPPTVVESFSGTISFTINDQQGGNFTGSGILTNNDPSDGGTDSIVISPGTIQPNGSVTATLSVSDPLDPASATLTGNLSGDTLSFTFSGSDTDCIFSGAMSLSRAASIIVPADAPSNAVSTQSEVDSFMRGQPVANSNRIRSVLRGGGNRGLQVSSQGLSVSGMAAGEGGAASHGAWFGYSYTDTENDFSTTAFTSARHSVLFGVDTMPADNWLLGVSMGIERSDIKTGFNNGEQDVTAVTVAPYMGLVFNDWLTMDASVGISDVKNEQFRLLGTTRVTSDVRSVRWFANVNLAVTRTYYDALRVTGLAGLLWASQRDEDFIESNGRITRESRVNVGRSMFGGEIAYSAGAWEPYASGLLEYDLTRSSQQFAPGVLAPKDDSSDMLLGIGLRYFGKDISGSLEYSTLLGRQDLDEDSINASIRWQF